MLQALPGRGAITRVTVRSAPEGADVPAVEARVIPRPSHRAYNEFDVENPNLVPIAESVDVVLPHGHHRDSTGLVLTFTDEAAARAFGRAAYRAAVILGQQVPVAAYDTAVAQSVADLPDVAYAGQL